MTRCWMLFVLLLPMVAWADIDISEYETKSSLKNPRTQKRYLDQIATEKAEEERREAELLAAEKLAEAARRLADEARPWPERLTEMRCTACHVAEHYTQNGHTSLGWWLVVLRMKEVNKVALAWDEARLIVTYLSEQHPANPDGAVIEWGAVILGLGLPFVAVSFGRRISKGRHQ